MNVVNSKFSLHATTDGERFFVGLQPTKKGVPSKKRSDSAAGRKPILEGMPSKIDPH